MYKIQLKKGAKESEKGRYAKLLEKRELENYMGAIGDFYSPELAER